MWDAVTSQKRLAVQWQAWLSHTRIEPPTIEVCYIRRRFCSLTLLLCCRNCSRTRSDKNGSARTSPFSKRGMQNCARFRPLRTPSPVKSRLREKNLVSKQHIQNPSLHKNQSRQGLRNNPPNYLTRLSWRLRRGRPAQVAGEVLRLHRDQHPRRRGQVGSIPAQTSIKVEAAHRNLPEGSALFTSIMPISPVCVGTSPNKIISVPARCTRTQSTFYRSLSSRRLLNRLLRKFRSVDPCCDVTIRDPRSGLCFHFPPHHAHGEMGDSTPLTIETLPSHPSLLHTRTYVYLCNLEIQRGSLRRLGIVVGSARGASAPLITQRPRVALSERLG